jgi:hypothetical protein
MLPRHWSKNGKSAIPFSCPFIKENPTDQPFFYEIVNSQHNPTHQFLKEQKEKGEESTLEGTTAFQIGSTKDSSINSTFPVKNKKNKKKLLK